MSRITLWKMHGAGNDFLIFDNRKALVRDKAAFAKSLCHRHFGVGADGLIAAEASSLCGVRMAYYNADGTKDSMCGNGIRCLAKFLRDQGIVREKSFTIETEDGVKEVEMIREEKRQSQVKIHMGAYTYDSRVLHIDTKLPEFIRQPLLLPEGRSFEISCIHLGVNHGVVFVEDEEDYVGAYGKLLEEHPMFLADMNINFVRIKDPSHIQVSTWERGVGRTLACGTGVSSSVVMACRLFSMDKTVEAQTPGGRLVISFDPQGRVFMQGPAEKTAEVMLEWP